MGGFCASVVRLYWLVWTSDLFTPALRTAWIVQFIRTAFSEAAAEALAFLVSTPRTITATSRGA